MGNLFYNNGAGEYICTIIINFSCIYKNNIHSNISKFLNAIL